MWLGLRGKEPCLTYCLDLTVKFNPGEYWGICHSIRVGLKIRAVPAFFDIFLFTGDEASFPLTW